MEGLGLVKAPRDFGVLSVQDLDWSTRLKFRTGSPAQRRAIAPELMPAIEKGIYPPDRGAGVPAFKPVQKWMPRGLSGVPITKNVPVTVLNQVVPIGYTFALEQAAFHLSDTTDEFNYTWALWVNGINLLDTGTTNVAGRPVFSSGPFSLGDTRDEQVIAGPGTQIRVVVNALNTLASTETVAALVIGSLRGI